MMKDPIDEIRNQIINHESNREFTKNGIMPLFSGSSASKILIIGQAPGIKAQTNQLPWADKSGLTLMKWLGMTEQQFRDTKLISLVPMDFYYPGKGKSGDLPPRKDFAPMWHTKLIKAMPEIKLTVLIGSYAQAYYLGDKKYKTLTETVLNYKQYLPQYFPIVHPSPLNFRWIGKNKWFETETVPALQKIVSTII